MSDLFPPQTKHAAAVNQLTAVLRSVIEGRSAVYLSAPITTGERFVTWYSTVGSRYLHDRERYIAEHFANVIVPNRAAARPVASRLRQDLQRVIIDPTALEDLSEWTQEDYRYFWGTVIAQYADTVVFMEGWPLSSGCAYEYLVAVRSEAATLTETLTPIPASRGLEMLASATHRLRKLGVAVRFHESVIADLQEWCAGRSAQDAASSISTVVGRRDTA